MPPPSRAQAGPLQPELLYLITGRANILVSDARRREVRRAGAGGVAEDDNLVVGATVLGPDLAYVVDRVRRHVGGKGYPEGFGRAGQPVSATDMPGEEATHLPSSSSSATPARSSCRGTCGACRTRGECRLRLLVSGARPASEEDGEGGNKQLCMPPSQYRGVMLVKLPE